MYGTVKPISTRGGDKFCFVLKLEFHAFSSTRLWLRTIDFIVQSRSTRTYIYELN